MGVVTAVPAPQSRQVVSGSAGGRYRGGMAQHCPVCDPALVRNGGRPPHDVDVAKTSEALRDRVRSGQMKYVRGDVPLEDMLALAESDMKYTIVSFLKCEACRRTRFWGLCIRGAPSYKIVDADQPSRWPWEAVPSRLLWAHVRE
ncbi:MAG: hypothetical protein K0R99_4016 [Microbacterium sp.]|nr:hypothetical protein [Microbacterium sp.]